MAPTNGAPLPQSLTESNGYALIDVASVYIVLCVALVALRYLVRRSIQSPHGWDDYLIYPALIANIGVDVACIASVQYGGFGRHTAYWEATNPAMIGMWAKLVLSVEMTYLLAVCLSKVAILAVFLRIFRSKQERMITYVLVGVVVATWLSETLAATLQCLPFEYQWDKTIPGGHCFNQQDFYSYLSVPNFVTDAVMLIIPLPMVWKLHTSKAQKIGLTFVFLVGSIGLVFSCIRFAVFINGEAFVDPTWASVGLCKWAVIEPGMYLISACLPSLRPLLSKFSFSSIRKYSGSRSGVHAGHHKIVLSNLSSRRLNSENDGFQKLGKDVDSMRHGIEKDDVRWESVAAHPMGRTEAGRETVGHEGGDAMRIVVTSDYVVQVSEGTEGEPQPCDV